MVRSYDYLPCRGTGCCSNSADTVTFQRPLPQMRLVVHLEALLISFIYFKARGPCSIRSRRTTGHGTDRLVPSQKSPFRSSFFAVESHKWCSCFQSLSARPHKTWRVHVLIVSFQFLPCSSPPFPQSTFAAADHVHVFVPCSNQSRSAPTLAYESCITRF